MNICINKLIYTGAEEGVEVVAKITMTFVSFQLFVFYMHFDIHVVL